MSGTYYLPSCAFTRVYPRVSERIRDYVRDRWGMRVLGCCEPACTSDCPFEAGDAVCYVCHNCEAIVKESHPEVRLVSVWEKILEDPEFVFPDYGGKDVLVQDCWRTNDCPEEQEAVRALLARMNFRVRELPAHGARADFCGASLYRPTSRKNVVLAPHRFTVLGAGKFVPHGEEEQRRIMREYCRAHIDGPVVAYCKHCAEGLSWGGADVRHLGSLLFDARPW